MKLVYLGLEVAVESEPTLSVTDLPDPGSPRVHRPGSGISHTRIQ